MVLGLLALSCIKKNKNLGGTEYDYSTGETIGIPCTDTIPVQLTLHVTHEEFDSEHLSKYKMAIVLDGTNAYEDNYKEKIEIKKLCAKNGRNRFFGIRIYLFKEERMFYFAKKTSFDMKEDKEIYIKLTSDTNEYGDNYQEKTNGDFFYSF